MLTRGAIDWCFIYVQCRLAGFQRTSGLRAHFPDKRRWRQSWRLKISILITAQLNWARPKKAPRQRDDDDQDI